MNERMNEMTLSQKHFFIFEPSTMNPKKMFSIIFTQMIVEKSL